MNKILKYFIAFTIIPVGALLCFSQSFAQQIGELSLKEAIDIAHEQSSAAQAARYSLLSSIYQNKSSRADLLPRLVLTGRAPNYQHNIIHNVLDDVTVVFSQRQQSAAEATLKIEQDVLWTGGTISLSSGVSKLGMFYGEDNYYWQSSPLVIGIEQPIFQFNSLKWQHKIAPLELEIAQKEYVEDMEDLSIRVTRSFFNAILAKANVENAEFNVSRNDSIYTISQGRYEQGTIAENDLLQTKLALKNAKSDLVRSKIDYQRSINNLKILLGYSTDVELTLKVPNNLPNVPVNIEKAKQLAFKNNSEALNYKLNEIQADRELAAAKGQGGLSATIRANYGLNKSSANSQALYTKTQSQQFFTVV